MTLPCDNLHDFIDGTKKFYAVDENKYHIGDTVTLYNDQHAHDFKILNIINWNRTILVLKGVERCG